MQTVANNYPHLQKKTRNLQRKKNLAKVSLTSVVCTGHETIAVITMYNTKFSLSNTLIGMHI